MEKFSRYLSLACLGTTFLTDHRSIAADDDERALIATKLAAFASSGQEAPALPDHTDTASAAAAAPALPPPPRYVLEYRDPALTAEQAAHFGTVLAVCTGPLEAGGDCGRLQIIPY